MHGKKRLPAAFIVLAAAALPAQAQDDPSDTVEPAYLEQSRKIKEGDASSRLALAGWCLERGLIREMMNEAGLVLEKDPDNQEARRMLHQRKEGDGWVFEAEEPALMKKPEPDTRLLLSQRERMLNTARTRDFKMAQKAVRFDFWTDLDRDRIEDYAKLLNPFYNSLSGFFQITKSERGINVFIFSKRSDYLDFYGRHSGKSGEHTSGFFSYDEDESLLCFYDDPYDDASVFDVAKHECTHLLVKQCLEGARMANWLNEGLACFFAGEGEEPAGPEACRYMMTVRHLFDHKAAPTLKELMEIPYKDFRSREYALAWSWIYCLRSNPDTRDNLKKLLIRLRQESKQGEDKDLEGVTNSLFQQIVGPPERLQAGWNDFAAKELLPKTEEQFFFCADWCLEKAGGYSDLDPKLKDEEKRELLRKGEEWLQQACATTDSKLKGRCEIEKVHAMLARARCMEYDFLEMTYAAAEALRLIDKYLLDPAGAIPPADAALLAHRALVNLWRRGDFRNPEGSATCDFTERFDHRRGELEKRLEQLERYPSRKEEVARELKVLPFQKKVVEHLIAASRYGYGQALALDPAHHQAKLRWLYMTLDFNVKDLDAVFPHVLFQAELDPDDVNLAALAAAYAAAGKKAYARSMLDRAYGITPDKDNLESLAEYVNGEDR